MRGNIICLSSPYLLYGVFLFLCAFVCCSGHPNLKIIMSNLEINLTQHMVDHDNLDYLSATNFDNLSFAAINCNSLNMSQCTKSIQKVKLYGISKLKTDFIFLSDIRMISKNKTSAISNVRDIFKVNPYKSYTLHFNSKKNSRGVGILVSNNINFLVEEERRDEDDNWILIRGQMAGKTLVIGAVYGPNDHDPSFFRSLKDNLRQLGDFPVLLGGGLELHF